MSQSEQRDVTPILCPYKGLARKIHPEVCKWRKEENDSEYHGMAADSRADPLRRKSPI